MDLKRQTVDAYNTAAEKMAQKFNDIGARVRDVEQVLQFINKENPFVIEIGCGNGRDAAEIVKHTNHYLGIDISERMVALAREAVPEGTFIVADLETYPFPPGVDVIFSFASLLHSSPDAVRLVLQSAAEGMAPGGIVFLSLKQGAGQETKKDEFGTRTFFYYAPKDIQELAGDAFETIFVDEQELRGQRWFTIVLKKS